MEKVNGEKRDMNREIFERQDQPQLRKSGTPETETCPVKRRHGGRPKMLIFIAKIVKGF